MIHHDDTDQPLAETQRLGHDCVERRLVQKSGMRVRRGPVVVHDHSLATFHNHPADSFPGLKGERPDGVRNAVPHLRNETLGCLVPEEQRPPVRADEFHRAPVDQGKKDGEVQFPRDLCVENAGHLELLRSLDELFLRAFAFGDVVEKA